MKYRYRCIYRCRLNFPFRFVYTLLLTLQVGLLIQVPSNASGNSAQAVLFDFPKLPKDLQIYFLRFFLLAPGGMIVNPWHQNEQEIHEGPEQSKKYSWAKYFRPAILATSSAINYEGTKILYEQITFVLTRKVFDGPENRSQRSPSSFPTYMSLVLPTVQVKSFYAAS